MRRRCSLYVTFILLLLFSSGCGSAIIATVAALQNINPQKAEPKPDAVNTPPIVVISPITGTLSGDIEISYTLSDQQSNPADIRVRYSTDFGITWLPQERAKNATEADSNEKSEGVTNLTTSPAGVLHYFIWKSRTDLGSGTFLNVRIQITPSDEDAGSPVSTVEFAVDNNPPTVEILPISGTFGNRVVINYYLIDAASNTASISIKYSTNTGETWLPEEDNITEITGAPSEGIDGIATSPIGVLHTFVWNSRADIGDGIQQNVKIQITPSDLYTGSPAETDEFTIDTTPPTVEIVPITGIHEGNVNITYILRDEAGDPAAIFIEYSKDSGTNWFEATESNASGLSEGTVGLSTSQAGTLHLFVWDSSTETDLPGEWNDNVYIRITPEDNTQGLSVTSTKFTVDNNTPPSIIITDVVGVHSGEIPINYTLFDSESNLCSVEVFFQIKDETTLRTATRVSGCNISNLSASSEGVEHTFNWDSIKDMGSASNVYVTIHIFPSDYEKGAGVVSIEFLVDNSAEHIIEFLTISGEQKRNIPVFYRIFNDGNKPANIQVKYSTGTGSWTEAAEATGSVSEGTTNLSSSPDGILHVFVWDSAADIGAIYTEKAQIKIIPENSNGFTSAQFTVGNNSAPYVLIDTPTTTQWGNVNITYRLVDDDSTCSISVLFSDNGGVNFSPATKAAGGDELTNLSTGIGIVHSFSWNSRQDIGTTSQNDICIKIVPKDSFRDGIAGITEQFSVDNANWSVPEVIAVTIGQSRVPSITVDSAGTVHVVWEDNSSGTKEIFYSKYEAAHWSLVTNISGTIGSDALQPYIAAAPSNNLCVIWQDKNDNTTKYDIYCSKFDKSTSTWSAPVAVYSDQTRSAGVPKIIFSKTTPLTLHAVYRRENDDTDIMTKRSYDGGMTWSYEAEISNDATDSTFPSIVIGPQGVLHVVWHDPITPSYIYYKSSSNGTEWGSRIPVSNAPINAAFSYPSISVGSDNKRHVVWDDNSTGNLEIFYSSSPDDTSWSEPVNLSGTSGKSEYPCLVMDSSGTFHLIYSDNTTGNQIWHRKSSDGGNLWSVAENVSDTLGNSENPRMVIGEDDTLHVVWQDNTTVNYEIYYSRK
ncbi:MAG: sialidase family protein [Planctomycetota bacterium]